MANVKISIISEFLGKGLKDADKSLKGFEKSVKRVGYLFGGGYLGAKVLGFAKESIKAFAADENAARSLGLTIKNLGLNYEGAALSANNYISNLEAQTGVLDDELRPAMDRLLRATGSITKSQELLGLSLDIAAGTGKTLTQVSQSLQKAYLGQTQALGRLGVGLSKAELTSSSFEEIQNRLTILFKGQAVSAANSYQGSIDKLAVSMNNAKEIIGKGMVDALVGASGNGGLQAALDAIAKSAQIVGDLFVGLGRTRGYVKALFTTEAGVSPLQAFKNAQALAAEWRKMDSFGGVKPSGIIPSISSAVRADVIAKAEKKSLDNAKAMTKEKSKQLALDKAKANLAKAQANFDITKINLAAALKGKISKEEENRLLALQAIENENGELALKYIAKLDYARQQAADAEAARQEALISSIQARMNVILALQDRVNAKISGMSAGSMSSQAATVAAYTPLPEEYYQRGGASLAAKNAGLGPDNNLTIRLDGQAFEYAVVNAVNNATSSGSTPWRPNA